MFVSLRQKSTKNKEKGKNSMSSKRSYDNRTVIRSTVRKELKEQVKIELISQFENDWHEYISLLIQNCEIISGKTFMTRTIFSTLFHDQIEVCRDWFGC